MEVPAKRLGIDQSGPDGTNMKQLERAEYSIRAALVSKRKFLSFMQENAQSERKCSVSMMLSPEGRLAPAG